MRDRCILCAGELDTPLTLDNMPASAQGFTTTSAEALRASAAMNVFACQSCGLIQYLGPLVPYYKEVIRSTRLSKPMLQFRRGQFSKIVEKKNIKSVFELGVGAGEYLDIFKKDGVNTFGIEGSAQLANHARTTGHSVYDGFLPKTNLKNQIGGTQFDLVTSFNFIEHLPDPRATLQCLIDLLKPGGYAILEVPNFNMIAEFKLFNEFIPDHRSYFTKNTFQLLLSITGFEILSIESIWDDYILSATAKKREPVNWDPYLEVRSSLSMGIEEFFGDSPKAENAIWSAGHQSLATISNLELEGLISCIIDSSPKKQSRYAPASGIPIVAPDILAEGQIKKVLLSAAGFNPEIKRSIKNNYDRSIKLGFLNKGKVEVE